MDNRERRDAGLAYVADGSVFGEGLLCKLQLHASGRGSEKAYCCDRGAVYSLHDGGAVTVHGFAVNCNGMHTK